MPKVLPEYKKQAAEKILQMAKAVFAEKGYYEARMEDIAERVGVSKRTLYLYFKNKEDLFKAICAAAPESLQRGLESALNTSDLMATCEAIFDSAAKDPYAGLNFEMLAAASRNPELRKTLRELYENEIDVTEQFLKEMKRKRLLPQALNTALLARGLIALYDGITGDIVLGLDKSQLRETWLESARALVNNPTKTKP
jgi:AcrR family transcriptional regulator